VSRETDVTLRGAFSGFDFPPNIAADPADQLGAALTLRPLVGARFLGVEWGTELGVEGQAGSYRFARPSAALRGALPLGGLSVAVEAAAGTSLGDVPVQSLWRLGGSGTLRGYDGSSAAGTAFWRGRGEVGSGSGSSPMRIALFSDVGWAGSRGALTIQHPLWSVGAGFSVLEGLFRVDLARALRQPTGWRLELYMDGAL
jgi:hemolysin activation/secretion protein